MSLQSDIISIVTDENAYLMRNDVKKESHMSWIMAAGLIVNAAMGAGLLNIAKAYDDAGGITVSSILHAIVVLLVIGAYAILFVCCDKSIASYEAFVLVKCGKFWQRVCSVCIILYMYGLSITFFIIIGDQLDRFLTFVVGEHYCSHWYLDRRFMIIITSMVLVFPLCFSKTIKFLQIPSMLGVLAIIYVVIMVPVEYFVHPPKDVIIKKSPDSWTDIFLVLPTMCFSYQAHVNAVPVFVSLKTRAECVKATLASTIVLICSYCSVAICGYLTFGITIDHDILMSYDPKLLPVLIAVIMVAIKTYTAYPVNLFCGRIAIDSFSTSNKESSIKRRVIIVCLWFFSTLVGAVFLPNISLAIHYLGALAASFIFIFPGLCLYFHIEEQWIYSWHNVLSISIAIFYVAIGVFITLLTLVQSLMADIGSKASTNKNIC
ncbi:unnamed protein product [Rotaria magnacalcarata]|uniref:Amino acid transporter transmembrane domain-containing protein n=2 Tax=Rotaria magnacalcarata TaxID=392030 RepID=A0A816XQB9_9BILA|nr:unnamed protein product [Rotaria magnacalcarata]